VVKNKRQAGLIFVFIIICGFIVFPFIMLVSVSLSDEQSVIRNGYRLIPEMLSLDAYKFVFKNPISVLNAYKITGMFSVLSMVASVMMMSMIAYPLSRTTFSKRRIVSFFLYFTMLFSGGLVPSYILITQYLHLDDTIWVYILPAMISPWYVFMIRTFFQGLPEAIIESAYIDGASEFVIFLRIVVPLSKPVLATIALLVFLDKWNDWYTSMLYINNEGLISLQYLLQRIMNNITLLQDQQKNMQSVYTATEIPSETVRMAMAVVVAGPALFVFPFFQKYFVKGLTVGSVKG